MLLETAVPAPCAAAVAVVVEPTTHTPLPTPSGDDYYPGPIRQGLDELHAAVSAFLADHPEFTGHPIEVVAQFMDRRAGYRSEAEAHTRQLLADEGVPEGWQPEASDDGDVLTSDDL